MLLYLNYYYALNYICGYHPDTLWPRSWDSPTVPKNPLYNVYTDTQVFIAGENLVHRI